VVYVDETGEKVDGKKHWFWCFTTETETLAIIRKNRGKNVFKETLGKEFEGVIVCDGWKSTPTSPITSSVIGLKCLGRQTS
jgi:transposase